MSEFDGNDSLNSHYGYPPRDHRDFNLDDLFVDSESPTADDYTVLDLVNDMVKFCRAVSNADYITLGIGVGVSLTDFVQYGGELVVEVNLWNKDIFVGYGPTVGDGPELNINNMLPAFRNNKALRTFIKGITWVNDLKVIKQLLKLSKITSFTFALGYINIPKEIEDGFEDEEQKGKWISEKFLEGESKNINAGFVLGAGDIMVRTEIPIGDGKKITANVHAIELGLTSPGAGASIITSFNLGERLNKVMLNRISEIRNMSPEEIRNLPD